MKKLIKTIAYVNLNNEGFSRCLNCGKIRYIEEKDIPRTKQYEFAEAFEDAFEYVEKHGSSIDAWTDKTIFLKKPAIYFTVYGHAPLAITKKQFHSLIVRYETKELDENLFTYSDLKEILPINDFLQYLEDHSQKLEL